MNEVKIILSCEHGGNFIPKNLLKKIDFSQDLLGSHMAYDRGALDLALFLQAGLNVQLISNKLTRLLIDFNRTEVHKAHWGKLSKFLSPDEKRELTGMYRKHVDQIDANIKKYSINSQCVHFSIHSFTPIFKNRLRKTEIGLLFDPSRKQEVIFCNKIKQILSPSYIVHFNRPYRGVSDGLTTYFRQKYEKNYAGIEIEINQSLFSKKKKWLMTNVLQAIQFILKNEKSR